MSNPWKEIKTPLSQYNVRRVDHQHPYGFFWAKDVSDDYLFMFQCSSKISFPKKIPALAGVGVIRPEIGNDDKTRLILKLKNREDWDIFHSLCLDIVVATRNSPNEETVVVVIVRRLERWHLFLKKDKPKLMSDAEQKGLIGELLFLKDYIFPQYAISDALSFWQGPLNATQDFNIENIAVEVKCQIGTSKPHIKISSINQLNTQLNRLYLFVVTLGKASSETNEAINLPIIISDIRNFIQTEEPACLELFNDLLLQTGYLDIPEYADYFYILSSCNAYEVQDDFPKIHVNDIPEGVINATFEILLDKCLPYRIDLIKLKTLRG